MTRRTRAGATALTVGLTAGLAVGLTGATSSGSASAAAPAYECLDRRATIVGTPGDETIRGTPGDDVIVARGGDDLVFAGGGHDVVCGGGGRDELYTDSGRMTAYGGAGNDRLETFFLGGGTLLGGQGDDKLDVRVAARSRRVQLDGGPGRDRVLMGYEGERSRPLIAVDRGNDSFRLDDHRHVMGRYEHLVLVGPARWEFRGTSGGDSVQVYSGGPLRAWTYAGNDWVQGSPRDDLIEAGAGRDAVWGNGGRDVCRGAERGSC